VVEFDMPGMHPLPLFIAMGAAAHLRSWGMVDQRGKPELQKMAADLLKQVAERGACGETFWPACMFVDEGATQCNSCHAFCALSGSVDMEMPFGGSLGTPVNTGCHSCGCGPQWTLAQQHM
jgi:hypothetical protein